MSLPLVDFALLDSSSAPPPELVCVSFAAACQRPPACLPACLPAGPRSRGAPGHADGLARSLQGDDPICTSGGEWGLLYPEPRHPAVGFPPVLHRCVPCPDCSRRSLTRGSLRCRTLSAALSSHSVARRDLVDAMFDQIATFMGQPIESKLSAAVDESSPIWCVGSTRRLVSRALLSRRQSLPRAPRSQPLQRGVRTG